MRRRAVFFPLCSLVVTILLLAPASSLAAARSLSRGRSGSDVKALQDELITGGYLAAGSASGYFGPLTQAAVEKFQCAEKIICTGASTSGYGIAGPKTQAALAGLAGSTQPDSINNTSLTGPATGRFEFSGWVPSWSAATGTASVLPHLDQLTSVMPFGYIVTGQGTIASTTILSNTPWPAFIAAAKAQKVRVIPTVEWGNGAQEQAILSDTTARIALENAIVALVKQNGFDGIDIDFEAKKDITKNYFSTFLKGLYQRMGNKWVYCTAEARMPLEDRYAPGATIPPDAADYANDYTQMNKYCDRVELMAYDQGTIDVRLDAGRAAPYAPVADPGWVSDFATLAAQSIAKNKIIIGVPTYGYEYRVTPVDGSYQYHVLWAFNPAYALQIAAQLGITPQRTSANELGFFYNPDVLASIAPAGSDSTQTQQSAPATAVVQNKGTVNTAQPMNYVTWSDAQAIADKVALARQLGVRGIAVFNLGGAEDPAIWSVLK